MKLIFEKEICGRCGGTGSHSFNQLDGDRCYGCNNRSGVVYTPNGVRAREAYEALVSKRLMLPASEVQVGMTIWASAQETIHVEKYRVGPGFGPTAFAPQNVLKEYKAKYRVVEYVSDGRTAFVSDKGNMVRFHFDGRKYASYRSDSLVKVHNPETLEGMFREIATKYKGATLVDGTAEEIATQLQAIDDAMHGRREVKVTADSAKYAAKMAAAKAERDAADLAAKEAGKAWRIANRELVIRMRDLDRSKADLSRWDDLAEYIATVKAGYPLKPAVADKALTALDDYEADQEALSLLQHVGTVDGTIALTVKVEACIPMDPRTYQGRTTYSKLIKFTDPDGNLLIWFGSSNLAFDLKQGDTLPITAKVKAHGVYEATGEKQTTINYVKRAEAAKVTVVLPRAILAYFSLEALYLVRPGDDAAETEWREAYQDTQETRQGKGVVKRLKLSKDAAIALGEYLKDRASFEDEKDPADRDINSALLLKKGRAIIESAGGHSFE